MKTVKPEELDIGMKFQLIGDACGEDEKKDLRTYEVTNKDTACRIGAHLIVKDETGVEKDMRIMPWVKVNLLEKS